MVLLQAILLGIVEGLTEFLPISSTGHLILAEDMLGYKDTAKVFTVVIQLGAIAAVMWYYRKDLLRRVRDLFGQKSGHVFWIRLFVASLPAVVVGFLFEELFTETSQTVVVATSLIVGGFVLLGAEAYFKNKHTKKDTAVDIDAITTKQALGIGVAQVAALIPGVSRSGATIVGGMFAGLNRVTAAAFSFYLSIPIIVGASGYKLIKNKDSLHLIDGGSAAIAAGLCAAFISALFVVGWLLKYVSKHDFKPFAYYRIVLGVLVFVLLGVGIL
jgi:undecaprenyl-diphosphatase